MCKYCNEKHNNLGFYENKFSEDAGMNAYLIPNDSKMAFDFWKSNQGYTDVVDIQYCPFCGRKLK